MIAILIAKVIGYTAVILTAFFFIAVFVLIVCISRNPPEDWE